MAEKNQVYTVFLRGGSANNTTNTSFISGTNTNCTFRVDWPTVLPEYYRLFKLQAYFRTNLGSRNYPIDTMVCVTTPSLSLPNSFDSNSMGRSNVISIAPMTFDNSSTVTYGYHDSTLAAMEPIVINYPTQSLINIILTDLTGAQLTDTTFFTSWVLVLTLTPVA